MTDYADSLLNKVAVLAVALLTAAVILLVIWGIGVVDVSPGQYTSSGEVTVSEGAIYLDRAGQPTFVGEVENDRGEPITDVAVTVEFFADGEPLGTETYDTYVSTIPDGAVMPFEAKYDGEERPDEAVATVSYESSDDSSETLTVNEAEIVHQAQDSVTVSGHVENPLGQTAERPLAIATFYDQEGTVIGVRSDRISPSSLEPGQTGEFTVRYATVGHVPSLAREYADYEIVVVDAVE